MNPVIKIPEAFESLFTPSRLRVYYGGRGGAKSESVARYLLASGMEKPLTILCARELQASIKDSVHGLLSDLIDKHHLSSFYDVLQTEIRGKNGTKFIFAGLRHNISSIKSMHEVNKCWVEEAETVSDHSWTILLPTIRAEGSEIIITFNPDIEDSPTYQRFVVNPPSYAVVKKINYDQNPYFPDVLRMEMEELQKRDPEKFKHVWLGFPKMAVEGAIYAAELQRARDDGRICDVPYDDRYPVSCFWDLGWADNTSIWFVQIINHEFRVIDCYQSQFQKTPHYIDVLNERGYLYDRIVLPHDATAEHANADRTWLELVSRAFRNANVSAGKRQPVEVRLEAVKNMFSLLKIDKTKCRDGLTALSRYHFAIDPETGKSSREPFHGPESNLADAFGYMCLEMEESSPRDYTPSAPMYSASRLG
jgi:phage terminase large subunit